MQSLRLRFKGRRWPLAVGASLALAGTAAVVVGDYDGLTSSGSIFDPFYVMAQPRATSGVTDPFANTAG